MSRTVFVLMLNDMRSPKYEDLEMVAAADSKEALAEFVGGEEVPPYQDGRWGKRFRQGGPLEWFNGVTLSYNHIVEVPYFATAS